MKKETFIANLNFLRIQVRNLYIALLKNDIKFADDVLSDIDDSVLDLRGDTEHLYKALDESEEHIEDQAREIENLRDQIHSQQETIHILSLTDEDELTRTGLLEEDE